MRAGSFKGPGLAWEDQPEDVLCTNKDDTYGKFAHYLLHDYKVGTGPNQGEPLRLDPAVNYLCTIINCAKTKFLATGSEATRLFFTCLDNKRRAPPRLNGSGM